ncbi:AAA family ATPase [Natronomonas sp. F2-12]|jgi:replication factor C small subunit|uniref:Replication factor C small subunit n=1 Tax=Natronomonas aquatica TaxID=2841590 RepID=A0A9R1CSH8_9EURY|nr:AAA family ATPase [Natronomonas aquatica]MCQ4333003.1 AAA family ATPase [Natronomonas aquatica]
MDAPLWTETHAPELSELPQTEARDHLERAVEEPMNLLVFGPRGVGKTAAAGALAAETHEDPENDFVTINVADFFGRTKKEIRNDERFASFLEGRSDLSKRGMISHVLKEQAAYQPVSGDFRTILLDNAETIREDFQQALRRVMEKHYEATQFVIATRQPSKLIAPIESRCFPVPMRAPSHGETVTVLERVVEREGVAYDGEGLEYVAGYGDGNLRRAILGAQTAAEEAGEVTMDAAYEALGEIGMGDTLAGILEDAENGAFEDARSGIDDLLYGEGYEGETVLRELLAVARGRYGGDELARIHALAGEIDLEMAEGTTDRVHLGRLLAELGR